MKEPFRELTVCSDSTELSRQAAARFVDIARQAVAQQGRFTVCLSGGSTPRGTYALLAREPFRDQMPWPQVHIFWGDERCIPLNHPDNHYRMASDLMLSKVSVPAENIHRMRGEATDPAQAAKEYEALLRSFFGLSDEDVPRFDLILLGMGADGHTASLLPGSAALHERQRLVVANYVLRLGATRLTLTLPVLNHAHQVMFLVVGEHKADAVRTVLQGDDNQPTLPAQLVRSDKGIVLWLVDEAAASRLRFNDLGLD